MDCVNVTHRQKAMESEPLPAWGEQVAERTITADLEGLISKAVDNGSADYAVVTGIQIHNWGKEFQDDSPTLEFVLPGTIYAVVGGEPK